MDTITIAIASDHAGFELKKEIIVHLKNLGINVYDFGSFTDKPVDYPDFAHPLAESVENGKFPKGI
jgi:ribose 5-phosphate isomerase B